MCGVVDGGIVAGPLRLRGRPVRRRRHLRLVRREPGARRATSRRPRPRGVVDPRAPHRPRLSASPSALTGWSPSTGTRATARSSSTTSCPGVVVGQTLATRPEQGYRALLEATAFGTRVIVETFAAVGRARDRVHRRRRAAVERRPHADLLRRPAPADLDDRQRAGAGARLGDPRRRRGRRVPGHPRRPRRDGRASTAPSTHRTRRTRRRLRPALRGVRRAARLVRPRRQRRHEAAASAPPRGARPSRGRAR